MLTLKLAGIEAAHGLGCVGVPVALGGAGGAAFKLGQPVPGTKPFTMPGSSVGTSPASEALRDAFPQRLPRQFATPVGGPGTGTPLRMAGTASVGAALGRAVPFLGLAATAYSAYGLNSCLGSKP